LELHCRQKAGTTNNPLPKFVLVVTWQQVNYQQIINSLETTTVAQAVGLLWTSGGRLDFVPRGGLKAAFICPSTVATEL
jgi:hypothetical protein